ncbi:zf-HC2 domain-containing protein [Amycolatopsis sp. CA-128772]|uniref:zf-HC2 domain-containing protein n=1 Tax=Amycolatopsis sp. CA-128772 TaxID=2073159 RepID=UPI000CD113B3|nr:zf-HC2 domain-containing protein [Amycolatopsis sp. CA-128772]
MRGRHGDAAAYGLGVLDDPEEFEAHLRGCARCRGRVAGFTPVAGALAEAARLGYLPPGDGAARRRKAAGPLLLLALGVAVTAFSAARPATGKIRFASPASIVSPGQVVAGAGRAPRSLPWPAGFQ